ncbi:ATP synthase F1 subunit gamma [uncultured Desulfobacter sp.]|uniref:ATP synthase F1 subunit gamma n=1 Tax=uncultured Desulfobacter sp. TaxID=240139 RepID=UPI0029F4EA81|nr:ATP synthase F1 subunit gamma [uncultured Desulfobacter sp.]
MATLKEVQSKIVSVKKTKQITSAMKMVATSRLRGSQNAMEAFKPYASKFAEVLGSIAGKSGEGASPLLVARDEVKKVALLLCTSDRGLCGGFNINLIDKAVKMLKAELSGKEVSFVCYGKKGRDWAKKQSNPIDAEYIGVVGGNVDFSVASGSGQTLINSFLEGNVDEVYLIYSEFQGMAKQVPTVKQILPIPSLDDVVTEEAAPADDDGTFLPEHICEPSSDALLGEMLPKNVFIQIYDALLQTSTSEHAARMRAMENATKACSDLVDELQTIFNKTRQAGITSDLMDIVGGAEALKG